MTGTSRTLVVGLAVVVVVLGTVGVRCMFDRSPDRRSPEACVGELTSYFEEVRTEQGTLAPSFSFKASDLEARLNATESGSRQVKVIGSEDLVARRIRQRCYQNCVLWSLATTTKEERTRLFGDLTACLNEERHSDEARTRPPGKGPGAIDAGATPREQVTRDPDPNSPGKAPRNRNRHGTEGQEKAVPAMAVGWAAGTARCEAAGCILDVQEGSVTQALMRVCLDAPNSRNELKGVQPICTLNHADGKTASCARSDAAAAVALRAPITWKPCLP
jgi:hypothetical protein